MTDEQEPSPLMRHVPADEYDKMLREMIALTTQVDNCRRILKRMGFLTDHPRLEDSLILFAFEAQFWEQDSIELKRITAAAKEHGITLP